MLGRLRLVGSATLLLAASLLPASAGTEPAEDPAATVFLRALRRGDAAPSQAAIKDLVVLSEVGKEDPWFRAVDALGHKPKEVVTFKPDALEKAFQRLAKLRPGFVVVLIRPESLDVNFHFEFLERASRLDDDPFVDFLFGYVTGATPEDAVAFAQGIAAARKKPLPRGLLEFGPSSQASPLTPASDHAWAEGFKTRRLSHAENAEDVAATLSTVEDVGILQAWGHGMPDRVSDGLTGSQIRSSGLDLHPALYFSGPCYCGVTGSWFGWERGATAANRVAPTESFLLALVKARVTGVFAGLDPDRGETCHHEVEHLLLTGDPLGAAVKSTYDDSVLAYRREQFVLPRYQPGRGRPFRDIHDQMISGSACRALFGDPTFAPFETAGKDPFHVETKASKDGLVVTWAGDEGLGQFWNPVDVCRAEGGWTHRLRFRFEVPRETAAKLEKFEVLEVTKDGKALPFTYATAALEAWGDATRVHAMVIFPPNADDRALWNGKAFAARLRFR